MYSYLTNPGIDMTSTNTTLKTRFIHCDHVTALLIIYSDHEHDVVLHRLPKTSMQHAKSAITFVCTEGHALKSMYIRIFWCMNIFQRMLYSLADIFAVKLHTA